MNHPDIRSSAQIVDQGKLALNPLVSPPSTAKACLPVEKHCRLVGCDIDALCYERLVPSLTDAYASKLLSQVSDLTDDEKLMESARIYSKAVEGRRLTGARNVLPAIQNFQQQVVSYLRPLRRDYLEHTMA